RRPSCSSQSFSATWCYRFLACNQRQVVGGVVHLLAVSHALADAHIQDDLCDPGHLHRVCVAELLRQLFTHHLLELSLQPRDIVGALTRLLGFLRRGGFRLRLRLLFRLGLGLGLRGLLCFSHRFRLRNAWQRAPFCAPHLGQRI